MDHCFIGSDNYYTANVFNYSFRNKLLSLFPCHTYINWITLIVLSSVLKIFHPEHSGPMFTPGMLAWIQILAGSLFLVASCATVVIALLKLRRREQPACTALPVGGEEEEGE